MRPQVAQQDGEADRHDKHERLVQACQAGRHTSGQRKPQPRGQPPRRGPGQRRHYTKHPEGFRPAGEVGAVVADGAEEQQPGGRSRCAGHHRGHQRAALLPAGLRALAPQPRSQQCADECGGPGVDHRRQPQRAQTPVGAPLASHHGLPEQQRWFGVAHVAIVALQGQPVAGLGRLARDMGVDHLVAELRDVQPVQTPQIGQCCGQRQRQPEVRSTRHAHGRCCPARRRKVSLSLAR